MPKYVKFGCKNCGSPQVHDRGGKLYCISCDTWFEKDVETNEERDARIHYLNRLDDAEKCLRISPPDFGRAEACFRDFINHYPEHSDGYWGLVRARYGIKYEKDVSGKEIPSCYKASYEDFRKDTDFLKSLELAECDEIYDHLQAEAKMIANVCKEWREEAKKYEYDVFISFKDSDDKTGRVTSDRDEMRELYFTLLKKGYKVFFSPETLPEFGGKYYDSIIFTALQSAKVMIVYGSKPEYFTATWVQNEWTRFLRMQAKGKKKKGSLIVAYKDFNPKELPHDLRSIQAINAADRSFHLEIIDNIRNLFKEEQKEDKNALLAAQFEEFKKQQAELVRKMEEDKAKAVAEAEAKAKAEAEAKAKAEAEAKAKAEAEAKAKTEAEAKAKAEAEAKAKAEAAAKAKAEAAAKAKAEAAAKAKAEAEAKAKAEAAAKAKAESEAKAKAEAEAREKAEAEAKAKAEAETRRLMQECERDSVIVKGCLEKYKGKAEKVVIPNSVKSIGSSAFKRCSSLTEIVIPNSVTSIGDEVFYGCSSLTAINVDIGNKNYTSIDGNLYSKDKKTLVSYAIGKKEKKFVIPNSVTSIGYSAFSECTSLTEVVIPSSVTSIDCLAFSRCSSLTEVVIPSRVTSISYEAFEGCKSLTEVVIPNSVTCIDDSAFERCLSLTEIVIPSSVTSIGDEAFYGCSSLTAINVDIDNKKYTSIDGNLYSKDKKTLVSYAIGKKEKKFVIPNSVTCIDYMAFSECTSLTEVVIPSSVTSIGDLAFWRCSSLTEVVIPSRVTDIGCEAFEGCSSLTIRVENPESIYKWFMWNPDNRPVYDAKTGKRLN